MLSLAQIAPLHVYAVEFSVDGQSAIDLVYASCENDAAIRFTRKHPYYHIDSIYLFILNERD